MVAGFVWTIAGHSVPYDTEGRLIELLTPEAANGYELDAYFSPNPLLRLDIQLHA